MNCSIELADRLRAQLEHHGAVLLLLNLVGSDSERRRRRRTLGGIKLNVDVFRHVESIQSSNRDRHRTLHVSSWTWVIKNLEACLAPRQRTALPPSRRGRDWLALPGLLPPGRLRGHGVFAALGKNLFDLGVRAGDDVY